MYNLSPSPCVLHWTFLDEAELDTFLLRWMNWKAWAAIILLQYSIVTFECHKIVYRHATELEEQKL